MTYKQIATMISGIGLPYAYHHFPNNTAKEPPFICFFFTGIDDLYADNSNYQRFETLNVELYTNQKDFANEEQVEAVLNGAGLTYYKEESYIESEQMWQIAYESEVLINGEQS